VTPSGGAATTQLTISTSAQSSALQPGSRSLFPLTALSMTVCLFGWRKRRCWHHWLLLAVAYTGLGLLVGCGGTSGGGGTSATNTPKSTTSTVTVTAISGALQGTATVTLTVN
jgi:peptidoglycan/LPS O-acetylase OafA/YrhL